MKFGWNEYFKPTPRLFRKIGDALMGAAMFAATWQIVVDNKNLAIAIMIIGTLGKFVTNFFSGVIEEDEKGN